VALLCGTNSNAASKRQELSTAEITKQFTDMVGTDGTHWAYHFKKDGSIRGTEMGRSRRGSWTVRHNQLCLRVPEGIPEECWTVVRLDGKLVFRRYGVDTMDVTVEKPSAKFQFD
jgi:hypothetical protein